MLTYEALVEQARIKDMPVDKIRGILREYMQILILKELYRLDTANKFYFTGGTYLRLACNLKRFSEDLDFYSRTVGKAEFEKIVWKINVELKRVGLEPSVGFKHWQNLYVARLIFPKVESFYGVVSKYSKKSGIVIKLESALLKKRINTETRMVTGFGEFYPCPCVHRGVLFADKIDALSKKNRGRHIYDIIFMLSNRYPLDRPVLKALGIKGSPFESIKKSIESFSERELKKQADILRPFLFDEGEADLVKDAKTVIPALLDKYP